jgi:hypothetical protein
MTSEPIIPQQYDPGVVRFEAELGEAIRIAIMRSPEWPDGREAIGRAVAEALRSASVGSWRAGGQIVWAEWCGGARGVLIFEYAPSEETIAALVAPERDPLERELARVEAELSEVQDECDEYRSDLGEALKRIRALAELSGNARAVAVDALVTWADGGDGSVAKITTIKGVGDGAPAAPGGREDPAHVEPRSDGSQATRRGFRRYSAADMQAKRALRIMAGRRARSGATPSAS